MKIETLRVTRVGEKGTKSEAKRREVRGGTLDYLTGKCEKGHKIKKEEFEMYSMKKDS